MQGKNKPNTVGEVNLSFNRKDLDELLNGSDYKLKELLELFEKDFEREYGGDVGVWENYSLKEHTLMVLNQFEKYFANKELPGDVDKNLFRVLLVLHDIGKPKAILKGNKHLQHQNTIDILLPVLEKLDFSTKELKIASALVSGDAIGDYVKHGNLVGSVEQIKKFSARSGLPLDKFVDLLIIYYKVDAGSYTKDAGGKESLDYLFNFDFENRNLLFSRNMENKVKKLRKYVLS